MNWIKLKEPETYPPERKNVLVSFWEWNRPDTNRYYRVAYWCENRWCDFDNPHSAPYPPTHWIEIPEMNDAE